MAETNQPGRLTWWGRARASSPRRPLPGVATEGPHRATAPAGTQALIQIPWQTSDGLQGSYVVGEQCWLVHMNPEHYGCLGFGLEQYRHEIIIPKTDATNSLRRGNT